MAKLGHHFPVAWQRADDLFINVHKLARGFPGSERFELAAQAAGSLAEAGYCLHAGRRLDYITEATFARARTRSQRRWCAARRVGASDAPRPAGDTRERRRGSIVWAIV
jgi:hypothetical protein